MVYSLGKAVEPSCPGEAPLSFQIPFELLPHPKSVCRPVKSILNVCLQRPSRQERQTEQHVDVYVYIDKHAIECIYRYVYIFWFS